MGRYFPSDSADVSCDLRLRDGTYALVKVPGADRKPTDDIATYVAHKMEALTEGKDPLYNRRKALLRRCPPVVAHGLDRALTFLGGSLGLSLPRFGVRPFPQGQCVVITSPAPASKSAAESDFVVEPEVG